MIACPICGAKTAVIETRASRTSARRRRRCTSLTGCPGKLTTIEVVVPEGRLSMLGEGSVVVSAKLIARLRKIVAAFEGGEL